MKSNYRIGIGYDIHRMEENRDLIIGGVKIPYEKGLMGHSDADVLIHAIIDAMLGALSMFDIGTLFPDNAQEFKDISSLILLEKVYEKVLQQGYKINNIDSNIIAQAPKMMPYIPQMKIILSKTLKINEDLISIKAKTNEGVDAVGNLLAIEANAVVLLIKIRDK
ncbi:MAG: 2-C-methyl-D-erythritol 2,4-cyclodiphosphate synthase [Candidatus Gastranaerophilales bacterium]|nr:2-C-methyl-D-erythritol 2,4-cyclodiphosphate synthase [Candidatus Gastranaerophilales bacterium]